MTSAAAHAAAPPGAELRRAPRFNVAGIRCGLGRPADFSRLGMRILAPFPWRVGVVRTARLRAPGARADVRARCVWRRREGILRWVCGVQFDDPNRWRITRAYELAAAHATEPVPPLDP